MIGSKKMGMFITMEGADGAGKTTHMKFLQQWLIDHGHEVVTTREPGGTKLGEALRGILLDDHQTPLCDEAELLLMFAARMQHIYEVIKPALLQNKIVLCDRFTDATFAYQGGGRGIEDERIAALEEWVQRGLQPDLTILLDVPVDTGLSRTRSRGESGDRFEKQHIEFKQAVRQKYLQRASYDSERIKVLNADQPLEKVKQELESLMQGFLA